ncbi:MAG: hypothetical protein GQ570_03795 [Helicobacteraceae bacterium]|nr:hypothetical protein [Helicobacteraceae bacterium]
MNNSKFGIVMVGDIDAHPRVEPFKQSVSPKKKAPKKSQTTKQRISNHKTTQGGGFKRCWETHPPLPIKVKDKTYYIEGGSCHHQPKDVDIFIGLDWGMTDSEMSYPWSDGVAFKFTIKDMSVPDNITEFKYLLNYLENSLKEGKRIYIGCIGGHGRTGLVFSALVQQMTGNVSSTSYVRSNYCKKAVESNEQESWLHHHFGITKDGGSKNKGRNSTKMSNAGGYWGNSTKPTKAVTKTVKPVRTPLSIHSPKTKILN